MWPQTDDQVSGPQGHSRGAEWELLLPVTDTFRTAAQNHVLAGAEEEFPGHETWYS